MPDLRRAMRLSRADGGKPTKLDAAKLIGAISRYEAERAINAKASGPFRESGRIGNQNTLPIVEDVATLAKEKRKLFETTQKVIF